MKRIRGPTDSINDTRKARPDDRLPRNPPLEFTKRRMTLSPSSAVFSCSHVRSMSKPGWQGKKARW